MAPILLALGSALGFGVSAIMVRLAGRRIPVPTGTGLSIVMSLGLASIPALVLELPAFAELSLVGILWILLLAIVNYPLARMFNFFSVSRIGASRAAPLYASSPLWSTLLAVVFLGERPNWMTLLGTVCVVTGIIIIVTERQAPANIETSVFPGSKSPTSIGRGH